MDYLYSFLGEFFGTAILIILGNGVVACAVLKKSLGNDNKNWVFICIGWGVAVFVAVLVAQAIGGTGYINPAVAIMDVIGQANMNDYKQGYLALMSIPVSVLGAMFGQAVLYVIYLDAYRLEKDFGAILGTHSTGPVVKNYRNNFLTEALATLVFVGAIASFGTVYAKGNTPVGTALSTLPVALLVMAIGFSLGGPTGFAINPARDLGPRIVHQLRFNRDSNWGYAWVPVAGPFAGGAVVGIIALLISVINK